MKIKVCGMTQVEQVNELHDLDIDLVGFIFYEKSPRYVLNHLTENKIKNIQGSFKKVGVFVNATEDFILQTMENCGLDLVQLHGDESPDFAETISTKVSVIKAFGVNNENELKQKIRDFSNAVDYFMFDTSSKNYGGTGQKFNWELLNKLDITKPFFLSGGIDENDVDAIHSLTKTQAGKYLFSLDINSQFETNPGIKNMQSIKKFVQQIKAFKQ